MMTQFNEYTATQTSQKQEEIEQVVNEYIGSFEPHLYCFQCFDDPNVYNAQTRIPFNSYFGTSSGEPVTIGHRFFDSKEQLKYYLERPNGVIWRNPLSWQTAALYISCHGSSAGLDLPMGLVTQKDLIEVLKDYGKDTSNIIYFSACSIFEDDDFGYELLSATQSKGILGFKKKINVAECLIVDMLFFSAFYLFDGNPFENLQQIFNAVLESFPPAKEMGWTLYI